MRHYEIIIKENRVRTTLRLPASLHESLQKEAATNGISLNDCITQLLTQAMRKDAPCAV